MQNKVTFECGFHDGKQVIWVHFAYNAALLKRFRSKFPYAKWSSSKKCWYVPDTPQNRESFNIKHNALVLSTKMVKAIPMPENTVAIKKFIETLRLKAYSESTIKTYVNEFVQLILLLHATKVSDLSAEQLRSYFLYCTNRLKMTESHLNSRINAIKFYFEQVLHKPTMFFDIPRPKKPAALPRVLSMNEIKRLFHAVKNIKHLLMLQLCYGMGLRVSEVVNLELEHIDMERMQVFIKRAKGKKDRYVNLPQSITPFLEIYLQQYQPKKWLFKGQYGGIYAKRSVQAVFKSAMQRANIRKNIGIHSLRHSYATHLLEYGTDISFIQKLMGHNSIKTTLLYTHISNPALQKITSPLDVMAQSRTKPLLNNSKY